MTKDIPIEQFDDDSVAQLFLLGLGVVFLIFAVALALL